MRILGIDYGTKRIGLAISDESYTLARELDIVSPKAFWATLPDILLLQEVEKIIVGLPLNMSGQDSEKTAEARAFKEKLEHTSKLPVEFMDERLSSVMAGNMPGGGKNVDSLAAQIILQNYLDKNKRV